MHLHLQVKIMKIIIVN